LAAARAVLHDRTMRPVLHADCSRARIRRAVQTRCQVLRQRDFKLVGTTVLDLSVRGMLVETHERILTGEELYVSFKSLSGKRWFDCAATVARIVHGRRLLDPKRALGIRFEGLDAWEQLLLCEDLRQAPVVARRRVPRMSRRTG
jgi:PilZ domain